MVKHVAPPRCFDLLRMSRHCGEMCVEFCLMLHEGVGGIRYTLGSMVFVLEWGFKGRRVVLGLLLHFGSYIFYFWIPRIIFY